eukprot:866804-Rhodomonas_salina.2
MLLPDYSTYSTTAGQLSRGFGVGPGTNDGSSTDYGSTGSGTSYGSGDTAGGSSDTDERTLVLGGGIDMGMLVLGGGTDSGMLVLESGTDMGMLVLGARRLDCGTRCEISYPVSGIGLADATSYVRYCASYTTCGTGLAYSTICRNWYSGLYC